MIANRIEKIVTAQVPDDLWVECSGPGPECEVNFRLACDLFIDSRAQPLGAIADKLDLFATGLRRAATELRIAESK